MAKTIKLEKYYIKVFVVMAFCLLIEGLVLLTGHLLPPSPDIVERDPVVTMRDIRIFQYHIAIPAGLPT